MNEEILIGVTAVIGLGIAAQWLAWRLKLPAILLLLIAGFCAGGLSTVFHGGTKWLAPDLLFGDVLLPVVALSVAIILFEGGLTLKIREFREVGRAVRNLVSVGVLITWGICGAAAHWLLGFDVPLSVLFGAMLTVTGPTVIGPLLRQVRPTGSTGTVLKWEGILVDPIGAVLAVLVFEAIVGQLEFHGEVNEQTRHVAWEIGRGIVYTLLYGTAFGGSAAALLVLLIRRFWVPDFLQSPVTLVLVVTAFTASNHVQEESGLLAVTIMGFIMANQKLTVVRHIIEFKENLRVLLISGLFIVLSARLPLDVVRQIGWGHLWFLLVVMFVARPIAVAVSTIGSSLNWRQRLFVGLIAPRGIVAAAIASIFAIRLGNLEYAGATQLVPAMFLVIVGTIAFCGLVATPLARMLKLAAVDPQGVLFIGAQSWAREIALELKAEGFDTLLVDTNRNNTRAARMAGLETMTGSILSEHVEEHLDLSRFSKLLAVTGNDEANSLAAVQMFETFGRKEVYQIAPQGRDQRMIKDQVQDDAHPLTGRFIVNREFTFRRIAERFNHGGEMRSTRLTEEFDWEDYHAKHGERATPLFLVTNAGKLRVFTAADPPRPTPGNTVIALIDPVEGQVIEGPEAAADSADSINEIRKDGGRSPEKPKLPG